MLTGSSSHGQGHETVWAQVAADKLQVPMESVVVRHGDTTAVQQGTGTFGSRSAVMGGGALATAADRVVAKAKTIAGNLMEASPDDVVQVEGGFAVAGVPERNVTWRQVAGAAYAKGTPAGMDPGLNETAFFDPNREAWGFGAHLALVRIDSATGELTIEKLVLVDDIGVVLNPMVVEAQVHGGLAQGLGEALCEHMVFDEEGQPRTGTLMDYAVPRALHHAARGARRDRDPQPVQPVRRQGRRRGRHQRRAAGRGQRRHGRVGASRHRPHRHAVHGAEAVASDSRGAGRLAARLQHGTRHEAQSSPGIDV